MIPVRHRAIEAALQVRLPNALRFSFPAPARGVGFRNHRRAFALSGKANAKEDTSMKRTAAVLATVATLGVATVATPKPAEAYWGGPGLAFGLFAGALTAGAIAASSPYWYGPDDYAGYYPGYYYGPSYAYVPAPAYYYAPEPYAYYHRPYYYRHVFYHPYWRHHYWHHHYWHHWHR